MTGLGHAPADPPREDVARPAAAAAEPDRRPGGSGASSTPGRPADVGDAGGRRRRQRDGGRRGVHRTDLLAEVYLVAWRKRDDLPAGDERRLWLFGAARRLLAEHHRSAWTRADTEHEAGDAFSRKQSPKRGRRDEAVRRSLDSLSDVDRELITLTTWEQLSPTEAARVVGITANTARVRLHRARARLARHPALQKLLEDGDREMCSSAAPPAEAAPAR